MEVAIPGSDVPESVHHCKQVTYCSILWPRSRANARAEQTRHATWQTSDPKTCKQVPSHLPIVNRQASSQRLCFGGPEQLIFAVLSHRILNPLRCMGYLWSIAATMRDPNQDITHFR